MSYAIGDQWGDPIAVPGLGLVGELAPLTIKDLACPTWGLGTETSADGTVITTNGPPWLPVIAPAIEAFSLDPMWALLCTGILTEQAGDDTFALYDLPIALTRGSGLVPPPVVPVVAPTTLPLPNQADPITVLDKQGTHSTERASPAYLPTCPADHPARTGTPVGDIPSPSPTGALVDPARPGSPAAGAAASPSDNGAIPADPQTAPADPKVSAQPAPQLGDDSQPQPQGLGAIIYNAFGKLGPGIGGTADDASTITVPTTGFQELSIGGGQVLSVDPSGIKLEGKTYSVGGPAMTMSNKVYTLVSQHESGDGATIGPGTPIDSAPLAPDTLTIAGHTVVPNPTGLTIAGSSVLPGGSAVTLSGTPISLDPSGILLVGSSSFSLPPQSIFTIGTRTITANPTGFVLDGAPIYPDGAAQTIDGTIVSLGHSGALTIGSSTISLPAPSFIPPTSSPLTVAGQTFKSNPTAFSIAGTTISAGVPAITLAGTIISLKLSGTLIVGSSTIALSQPPSSSLNIDGLTVEARSSFAIVDGVTINPGAPGVTIDGSVASLEPGGVTLDVGIERFALPTGVLSNPPSSSLNIDGFIVDAQSSLAIVDGVTVSPGAPGVTIDGSVISLEPGGATLDVGTARFALPTGVANGSSTIVSAFEGGGQRGGGVFDGLANFRHRGQSNDATGVRGSES